MNKGTRILLTGGAGFIGSHLAEALIRSGAELFIVDNLDNFYSPERKRRNLEEIRRAGNFEFFEGDICDAVGMRGVFDHAKPEIIVHLAARAGVRPSIEQPLLYEYVNVRGTANLLELAREFKAPRFIFGSSSSVYGATNRVPFSEEDHDLKPISPYAATKLAGEHLGYTYAHLYGLTVLCLRFFTVFGPRQRPDLAIHKFVALMENNQPIPVYGDGSSGRDYTFVDDIVAGVMSALQHQPSSSVPCDIFNIGNSRPVTLNDLIRAVERATGRSAKRDAKPPQPGDMQLTWANVEKAARVLGYRPSTTLSEGLNKFVAWYRADALRAEKTRPLGSH